MRRIEHYKVIYSTSGVALNKEVQDHIDNGWQPYGELKVGITNLYQAVVMYEAEVVVKFEGKVNP